MSRGIINGLNAWDAIMIAIGFPPKIGMNNPVRAGVDARVVTTLTLSII